jgi:hypothetical protein
MSHTLGQHSAALFWRCNAGQEERGLHAHCFPLIGVIAYRPPHHNKFLFNIFLTTIGIIGNIGRLFRDRPTFALHAALSQKTIGEFVDFSKIF